MTYQIQITPELKARLDALAAHEGTTPDAVAARTLEQHLPPAKPKERLLKLLDEWAAEEPEDDAEEFLLQLDRDRPSCRRLFRVELRGITW
jgi:predicted transcriptional regulator